MRLVPPTHVVQKSVSEAAFSRDNLTTFEAGNHVAKVCCICDRFILFGEEQFCSFDQLAKDKTKEALGKKRITGLKATAVRAIHNHYRPNCVSPRSSEYRKIRDLYLSPRSYRVQISQYEGLGCCKECKKSLDGLGKQKKNPVEPPRFAIANGLMVGPTPPELESLTDTEIALISLARVDKHVFAYQGGAHVQMKGWHSMYATDIESVNKTVNWCAAHLNDEDDDASEVHNSELDEEDEIEEDEDSREETNIEQPEGRKRFATICVILSGPFTKEQLSIVREKTKVDFERVKKALRWLKRNNRLYANYELDEEMAKPIFLEQIEEVQSVSTNVEKILEYCAVFPDSSHPDSLNGGFTTRSGFKEVTLERMLTKSKDRDAKLICKPTMNLLRDYEGDNLLKAFPVQFPYGVGSRTKNDEERYHGGKKYLQYLSRLSKIYFHRPQFVCVLHNMFERTAMRFGSGFRRKCNKFSNYVELTNESINEAAERLLNGVHGSSTADNFLRGMSAATKDMAHTNAAAKEARQKLYAMCAVYGVPSMMVTITPNDEYNFRIRVMHNPTGENGPPEEWATNDEIRSYLLKCTEIRRDYPGLCALDYENVMRIFLRHYVGWDDETKSNIPGHGVFGDVEAWSIATEEQGRKTLHGHSLVWLRNWPEVNERLMSGERSVRESAVQNLKNFSRAVLTTHVIAKDDLNFTRPCGSDCEFHLSTSMTENMVQCTDQDTRNLRCTKGTTSVGTRCIMKCQGCNIPYFSEDFAIAKIEKFFGPENVRDCGMKPTVQYGFWTKNLHLSNAFVRMERQIMEFLIPDINRTKNTPYITDEKSRSCIAIARNLHKSDHTKQCFKNEKSPECRMKLPCRPNTETRVHFEDKPVNWYTWFGLNRKRNLFFLEPKRTIVDQFANVHSSVISEVFGCNSNVVACVDGGSPMYVTNYTSKNTQEEDGEAMVNAAKHIVKAMRKSFEEHGSLFDDDTADETASQMPEEERKQRGMRALMGAVIMSTSAHVCSAPMASWLTSNESRFSFSHEFVYANLYQFEQEAGKDYSIGSDHDGTAFMTSSVKDYTCRPLQLQDVCYFDFLTEYSVSSPCADSLDWHGDHPSRNYRKVKRRKHPVIPRINHFDVPTSSDFDGADIRTCVIPEERLAKHFAMEEYAKKFCILFVPFRDLRRDVPIDGSFHRRLKDWYREGRMHIRHERILQNMQDVRNSLNAGRVDDCLEKDTVFQYKKEYGMAEEGEESPYNTEDLMDELLETEVEFSGVCFPKYRTGNGAFNMHGETIEELGADDCCRSGIVSAEVNTVQNHIGEYEEIIGGNGERAQRMDLGDYVNAEALHTLSVQRRERVVVEDGNGQTYNVPNATGTLKNLIQYGKCFFQDDREQCHAFVTTAAAFCLKLHQEAIKEGGQLSRVQSMHLERRRRQLARLVKTGQLIAFLNGPGGTGKSHVVNAIVRYCKALCENLNLNFDKRTIVVTAMSGSAAVSINGETTHMACCINKKTGIPMEEIKRWKHAYLLVVDEISFASKKFLERLNQCLGKLLQRTDSKFGGIHILFVGDMSQLDPVGQTPMYKEESVPIWHEWVHTFFELKKNHRFKDDPAYGECMARMRNDGPTEHDVQMLNSRVIGSENGPYDSEIPHTVTYATSSNFDRCAINQAIFSKHLRETHSKDPSVPPPRHTICIKASDLTWTGKGKKTPLNAIAKDIFHATCCEAHVFTGSVKKQKSGKLTPNRTKMHSPLLKLYGGRPLMLTDNVDVENGLANGSMCFFEKVVLRKGVKIDDLEKIIMDGYYVWCADATQVSHINVRLEEGDRRIVSLKATKISAKVEFPVPIFGTVNKRTERWIREISLRQFGINEANARTVHKLQGKSLDHVLVNSWKNFGHWAYVALSRVKSLSGLFLREPIDHSKCTGMDPRVRWFMDQVKDKTTDDGYLDDDDD